ncbi:phosphate acyltransferase PlsX [Lactobacillus paragasseri]|uniref:phosphate acyltransferase PlsX n=1 Tax=Lactobacillus paragasseri TaxID=2107999 RepID=UPI0012E31769|nr:phosphate acyltransferase PlsX [Lactobacillus paragasseri]MDK8085922.1 phosphate acyltransferase PlsX [Lactobacillus paragasseri]MDX5117858.1 phosphate acyltransferase PlsX [Lactobacillus paragasseri]MDX5121739.1 phosphate acyltransferase PlsX [Lactobacillus paragasseri]QGT97510.1 phosphate acyltransferase PlsX [Lactobacillus paragasseri]UWI46671.1 phosphate acyltransferase PlsX [Lactobacillus paragasseri]
MKKIAIDAMGGENAPQAIIDAVLKVKPKLKDTKFILFGDVEKINQLIPDEQKERIEVIATSEVIVDSDEPVRAIRRKKDSSMVVAANYVKAGKADALFSLGNTGALLACGIFIIGRIKGVERPALMPTLPSAKSEDGFNIIDVGANAQSKPEYLVQWAQMANFYAQKIRNIKNPIVALLNNGAEDDKGDPLHQEAYKLLKATNLNFVGNLEGNDLMEGKADVIVTDGFTGNATLKAIEGTASVILRLLKDSLLNNGLRPKVGALLAKPGLTALKKRFDTARYGGAVLLGVNAPVVKTHGRSNIRPIYYTLLQIDKMLSQDLVGEYKKYFSESR